MSRDLDFGQARGAAAVLAERREAAWAALVVGMGFLSVLLNFLGVGDPQLTKELVLASVIFGIIKLPQLEEVSVFARLALMTMLSLELLLFIRVYVPESSLVTVMFLALGALFASSMVNLSAQAGVGPSRTPAGATISHLAGKHAPYLGVGGVGAIVSLLI